MTEPQTPHRLGLVVGGSLTGGLEVRLDEVAVEEVKVGRLVAIDGARLCFFGTITDVTLRSTDPRLAAAPPSDDEPLLRAALTGTAAYATVKVAPSLVWDRTAESELAPARTVPPHFAQVREANDDDVARVFGQEDAAHFYIGTPLELESRLCLDLPRFAQRSNGVFGRSGTGKTFLTRLLLIGLLQKGGAVNLVFDMHNEYGWEGTSEGPAGKVKGLKQLFSSKVAVFTVDQESAVRRGVSVDEVVRIGWDEIEPQDIELLQETLNLTEAGVGAVYAMARQRGRRWLSDFLAAEAPGERADLTTALGEHEATIAALHRRLGRLRDFHFLTEGRSDALQRLLNALEGGRHVVLEFGRYSNNLTAYLLVANFLTRRVHQRWVRRTEEALGDRAQEPPQLVITLEEAHRFLSPAIAPRTIFGTIAREMRKYHATLLIIDQRPSGIDDEVLSQLGTKLCYRLDDDADIDAVLAGAAGRSDLKTVLANLDAKQQVLAFGDALPMPVVVRVREYGSPQSYRELGIESEEEHKARVQRDMERMFGA